jgi:5-methylcytosine-specific restriction endonuclease McrA
MNRSEKFHAELEKKAKNILHNHYGANSDTKVVNIIGMLLEFVEKGCAYCKDIFKLKDATLDHVIPLNRSKAKKGEYAEEVLAKILDDKNKVICCKRCNQAKSNMNGVEFIMLLKALRSWEKACLKNVEQSGEATVKKIISRLGSGGYRFK